MEVGELKKLLMKSKAEPVNCAAGLAGKGAVMTMSKIKQPKALSKQLQDENDDLKKFCWGTAFVDTDDDPKLVILTVNRPVSGLARMLKKSALKGTGITKVRVMLEDGSVAEPEEAEEEEEEGAQQTAAPEQPAGEPSQAESGLPTGQDPQQPQAATQPDTQAADQPQAAAPQQDMGPVTQKLTGLVKQMMPIMASDPSRGDQLKGLAAAAQKAVKGGNVDEATAAVTELEGALGQGGGTNGAAPPNAAALAKSRLVWVAARKKVEDELGKLQTEMKKHYDGHGFGADLEKVFNAKVEPMMETLDHSLSDKLDEVSKNTDPAQHSKLVGEAKQIISNYENFLASEKLIAQLDSNPFVPLAIQKTLTATLAALSKTVT